MQNLSTRPQPLARIRKLRFDRGVTFEVHMMAFLICSAAQPISVSPSKSHLRFISSRTRCQIRLSWQGAEKVPAGGKEGRKRATVSSIQRRPESGIFPNSLTFKTFPWFSPPKREPQPFFSCLITCFKREHECGTLAYLKISICSSHGAGRIDHSSEAV